MRTTAFLIAAVAAAASIIATPREAQAGSGLVAYLEKCEGVNMPTGEFVYVGTYVYANKRYTMSFKDYCPPNIEL